MKPEGRIVITGSVAFDYLMTFPGRFVEHLIPDQMARLSVSFLVDEMRRVPGGCGPNIAYGLALFGERPVLLATAGDDAAAYRDRLAREGVDVSAMRLEPDLFTASFFVSTDLDQNQLASFYTGAMSRARELTIRSLDPATLAFVVISPNDPAAMASHARECREFEIPFLYDPSQQVTRMSAEEMREGFRGAAILIVNDYELGILGRKTGLTTGATGGRGSGVHRDPRPRWLDHSRPGRPRGSGRPRDSRRQSRGESPGPYGRRRPVSGRAPARFAGRRPLARGRTARQRCRRFRDRSSRPSASPLRPADFIDRFRRNFGDTPELERLFG